MIPSKPFDVDRVVALLWIGHSGNCPDFPSSCQGMRFLVGVAKLVRSRKPVPIPFGFGLRPLPYRTCGSLLIVDVSEELCALDPIPGLGLDPSLDKFPGRYPLSMP